MTIDCAAEETYGTGSGLWEGAPDRADQADLDAHTQRDSAENSTATDGGFSKRELQNTRV